MGVVYLGQDPVIKRLVALKTIRVTAEDDQEEREFGERFLREAQAAGILSHPNIVTVHDVGEDTDTRVRFIAMEYVEGRNLKQLLAERSPFTFERIADVVGQVAQALDYAHRKGIVHRDVKPANVIITPEGAVKITDFGIAKIEELAAGQGLTSTGQFLGTPNYMSPEQVTGDAVDGRSDLFSLGVVLYELLTRKKPFTGENLTSISYKIVHESFTPPETYDANIPPEFTEVLRRALAKEPGERFQRGNDFALALYEFKAREEERQMLRDLSKMVAEAENLGNVTPTTAIPLLSDSPSLGPPPRGGGLSVLPGQGGGVSSIITVPITNPNKSTQVAPPSSAKSAAGPKAEDSAPEWEVDDQQLPASTRTSVSPGPPARSATPVGVSRPEVRSEAKPEKRSDVRAVPVKPVDPSPTPGSRANIEATVLSAGAPTSPPGRAPASPPPIASSDLVSAVTERINPGMLLAQAAPKPAPPPVPPPAPSAQRPPSGPSIVPPPPPPPPRTAPAPPPPPPPIAVPPPAPAKRPLSAPSARVPSDAREASVSSRRTGPPPVPASSVPPPPPVSIAPPAPAPAQPEPARVTSGDANRVQVLKREVNSRFVYMIVGGCVLFALAILGGLALWRHHAAQTTLQQDAERERETSERRRLRETGDRSLAEKKYAQALESYRELIRRSPDVTAVRELIQKAEALQKEQEAAEAEAKKKAEEVEAHLAAAREALIGNDDAKVVEEAELALTLSPDNADAAALRDGARDRLAATASEKKTALDAKKKPTKPTPVPTPVPAVAVAPKATLPPALPTATPATATLRINLTSPVAQGYIMVRLNDKEIFRKTFDFGKKSNGGVVEGTVQVPSGEGEFKVWVIAPDRSTNGYDRFRASIPGGETKELRIEVAGPTKLVSSIR